MGGERVWRVGGKEGGRSPGPWHFSCFRLTAGSKAGIKCPLWAEHHAWCWGRGGVTYQRRVVDSPDPIGFPV